MTKEIPKPSVLHEYLLIYGQEWVEEEYKITPNKIDQILYGGVLPTEEVLEKRKKDVERGMSWWKYYNDIENLILESGEEFWENNSEVIEDIALKYTQSSGVPIKTEIVDHFIWDKKYKSQIERENIVYRDEKSQDEINDFMEQWMEIYPNIMSRMTKNSKLTMSVTTSKTKEDGVHDMFLSNYVNGKVKDVEATRKLIDFRFEKSVINGKFITFSEK